MRFKSIFENKKIIKFQPMGWSAEALSALCNGEIRGTTLLSRLVGLFA